MITGTDLIITTRAEGAHGVLALDGGRVDIDPTTIITSATNAQGLFASKKRRSK